ncbi:ATP-binding protein [Engelhardtia mirabilis]|uniref:histidine kinase n=1 Tax=Engelhardtia mirabilis TaxID=2528011 RepID=A0A518BGC5_9BACT|nr:Wide host range VirA protein [Planctomycetes bacterium Pla133]QDV00347.1 Wide host range VirA protein [Planctomycetes bacterium Pla86]
MTPLPRISTALMLGLAVTGPVEALQDPVGLENRGFGLRHWTVASGLPQDTITAIEQTRDGYLWIGTFGGLARFDGREFEQVLRVLTPGLPDDRITALELDGSGALWVGTQFGGVARLVDGNFMRVPAPAVDCRDLFAAPDGRVWAVLDEGLYTCSPGESKFRPVEDFPARPEGVAWSRTRGIVVSGAEGLYQQSDGRWRPLGPIGLPDRTRVPVVALTDGAIVVGTPQGAYLPSRSDELDNLGLEPAPVDPWLVEAPPRERGAWLGSIGVSLLSFGDSGLISRLVVDALDGYEIRALFVDDEDSLWIGTTGDGLFQRFRTPLESVAIGTGEFKQLAFPDGRTIVALDARGHIHRLALDGGEVDSPSTDLVYGVAAWGDGRLLVAHDGRVDLWDGDRVEVLFDAAASGFPPELRCICTARMPDGTTWMTAPQGLVELRLDGTSSFHPAGTDGLPTGLSSVRVAPDGVLWVGGFGGLSRRIDERFVPLSSPTEVPLEVVRTISFDHRGVAWIGTYGLGLWRVEGDRVFGYGNAHGLDDLMLSGALPDGRGRLWVAGNRTLLALELEDLDAVAGGERRFMTPIVFGPNSGMSEASGGSPGAAVVGSDGRLYFTTVSGVVAVDPELIDELPAAKPPTVERARLNGEAVALGDLTNLGPGRVDLEFEFAAPTFVLPQAAALEYRLQGYRDEWQRAWSDDQARFTNVGSGSYRFEVRALGESRATAVEVKVQPRLVERPWFLALTTVLVGSGGWLLVRRLQLRARRRRAELERQRRLTSIGSLAGGLAHDLNNLLAPIMGYSELVAQALDPDDPLRGSVDRIHEAGARASELVREMLAFAGRGERKRSRVVVAELLDEVLRVLEPRLQGSRELDLDDVDPSVSVEGDSTQLHRVLMNLCSNALDAIEEHGGLRVAVVVREAELGPSRAHSLGLLGPGAYAEIEVTDDGGGIASGALEHIFEPFFTTKLSHRDRGRGSGMGLAVVHGLVAAHQGVVEVTTELGVGTTFRLLLPAANAQSEDRGQALIHPVPPPPFRGRLLVVDDDPAVGPLVADMARRSGYQTLYSQDPVDALLQVRSGRFAAVVVDLDMPDLDGLEVARRLRSESFELPIVLMTGAPGRLVVEDQEELARLFAATLTKPFSERDLIDALRQHVGVPSDELTGGANP